MQSALESEQALASYQTTYAYPCPCVHYRHFGKKWQLCLPCCIHVVESLKCKKTWGACCVCKSVCWGISIPLPWAICGQTDPIMFVLQDQIGCVSSSLAAHWYPFQPGPCTSPHPFKSDAQGTFLFCFIHLFWKANSGFNPWQLPWTDVNNYVGRMNTKDRRIIAQKCTKMCISEHV